MWRAAATSRRNSPPISGRCILAKAPTNTKNPSSSSAAHSSRRASKQLLVGGVQRLAGKGGDPVVQLQTNFGGGKTHSMLALYHLFSGRPPSDCRASKRCMAEAGITKVYPTVKSRRAGGQQDFARQPVTKPDGTVVRTLWGELAWQLGGKKAFARIAADDEKATNPGDVLRELFKKYGPCLILIDEWVAYARQLHDQSDLPGRRFRDAIHIRPGADRVGQARQEYACWWSACRRRTPQARRIRSRTTWKWAA